MGEKVDVRIGAKKIRSLKSDNEEINREINI